MITLESIQIGRVITEGDPEKRDVAERQWTTGFYKLPAAGPVTLTTDGLAGDAVADTRFHGGPDKAVLCYAAAHYRSYWAATHPDLHLRAGAFGENLTVSNADESSVCLGDSYRIGKVEIQVSQPRQPCWKISRRWGVKTLTKEVTQSGYTGWYCRVLKEGTLKPGQAIELIARPHADWSVKRANDILFGREVDRMSVMELMNLSELASAWKQSLA